MARKPAKPEHAEARPADPRRAVVEALLRLSAGQPYGSIALADIAREAGVSLADLRDLFPSKGAILGGLLRVVDRQVLEGGAADMAGETMHDRVLDVMMRRFDAFAPYKEGMRAIYRSLRTDPVFALQFNSVALNSWRYMLEAAGIDTMGPLGALRTQGAAIVFANVFAVWLDDEPDLARTMAALDRELKRGEKVMGAADALHRLAAPFAGFARAVCDRRRDLRRRRFDDNREHDAQYV